MQEVVTLISNVGFPIACCIVMFKQQSKLQETLTDLSSTLQVMSDRINDLEKKI